MIFLCDTELKIKQLRFLLSRITCAFVLSSSVVSDSLWPHGLYGPWTSPGQNTGVGSHSLLQGFFPSQGSNPGLLYCRQILYHVRHQGHRSQDFLRKNTGVGCRFLLQGIFVTQRLNVHLLHRQVDSLPLSHLGRIRAGLKSKVNPLVWPLMYRYYWKMKPIC